jgi:hypothetical protein
MIASKWLWRHSLRRQKTYVETQDTKISELQILELNVFGLQNLWGCQNLDNLYLMKQKSND